MAKIQMKTPIVEMDGDEMTRILWKDIKDILLLPYIDLKTEYYDLGLPNRDATGDTVTVESALATKKYGVAVKCATITPNLQSIIVYNLKVLCKIKKVTYSLIIDVTVLMSPIVVEGIRSYVPTWTKPIVLARHAYGDVYAAVDEKVASGSKAFLVIEDKEGKEISRRLVHDFNGTTGVVQGMHNCDDSIRSFAHTCFRYALEEKLPMIFATKDTISKVYDGRFKQIFEEVFEEYKDAFEKAGIWYLYTLIDDAVARVVRSEGGLLWACKNYDGDVMSDMVATAYGSLGMMTSVLVSPDGKYEYEAAHGTVTRHYYKHLKGEETSTNSVATIFAWTGALKKRGEMDGLGDLVAFAEKLERATIRTIEEGEMTGDLVPLFHREGVTPKKLNSKEFLLAIASRL